MNSKRILLTGSNGFLGQKLTERIVKKSAYTLACTSASENRNFVTGGYLFQQIDFSDLSTFEKLLKSFKPSHIIHTAAISNVERCENFPDLCQQVNVDTTKYIAEYCSEYNVHLTFLSTDFVFDGRQSPYSEDDLPAPLSRYGQSKLLAEQAIEQSGCPYAILRTILVYGIHGDRKRLNMVSWVKETLSKKNSINVVADQWRTPTYVDDLADVCIKVVETNAVGTFHVAGADTMTILQMAEKIADYWNLDKTLIQPINAVKIGHDSNRPRRTGFVLDKARQELDYRPTSFDRALQEISEQYERYTK